jgi:hypothetical protein
MLQSCVPLTYGLIEPLVPSDACDLCPSFAAVKAEIQNKIIFLCDIHAFVNSDTIWEAATAVYDRLDILPPKPE